MSPTNEMYNKTHLNQISDLACKANLYLTVQKTERIQKQSLYKLEKVRLLRNCIFLFFGGLVDLCKPIFRGNMEEFKRKRHS